MRAFMIAAAATLTLVACSNTSSAGGASVTPASPPGGGGAASVGTADVGDLGTVLVDGTGMTLYLFESDTGSTSNCTDACAGTWPALTTHGDATATGGADASLLGTTTRDDGSTQVTYDGHPIYRYSGDTAPGQANGEDIGGVWYAVSAQGTAVEPSGDSGDNGGYGGYGGG